MADSKTQVPSFGRNSCFSFTYDMSANCATPTGNWPEFEATFRSFSPRGECSLTLMPLLMALVLGTNGAIVPLFGSPSG